MRVLGIDPGSRLLGYGCVDRNGNQFKHVTHGTLRLMQSQDFSEVSFEDRLLAIYQGLSRVIQETSPDVMAVEKVFFAKNAVSALKLGQARGAAIVTGKIHGLQIVEYSATQIKQAIAGHGRAEKEQVAKMIQLMIGPQKFETLDASDALALAICHAQWQTSVQHGFDRTQGRAALQLMKSMGQSKKKKKLSLAESVGAGKTLMKNLNRK